MRATDLFGDADEAAPVSGASTSGQAQTAAPRPVGPDEIDWTLVQSTSIECILGGVLMRVTLGPGVAPTHALAILREWDPNVQVRTEWPRKGGGARETKQAQACSISVRVTDAGKFVDLVCNDGTDDLSVTVPKRMAETFLDDLAKTEQVTDAHLAKLSDAYVKKASATVILGDAERFTVRYFRLDDGRAFVESVAKREGAGNGA